MTEKELDKLWAKAQTDYAEAIRKYRAIKKFVKAESKRQPTCRLCGLIGVR